ncbi:MAG: hypothetical protein AAFQ94_07555 [Bacteroidota bacterium]
MKNILNRTTTNLTADFDRKIIVGRMTGDIIFDDYKAMLLGGARLASMGKADHIVIDRREVLKQDAECRLWVKNYYFKRHIKPLVPQIKKVAIVESQSIVGRIYGKTIFASLRMIYPHLKIKSFDDLDEAIEWIGRRDEPTVAVEELIKDEKSFFEDIVSKESEIVEDEKKNQLVTVDSTEADAPQSSESSLINKLFRYFFPD